MRRIKDAGYFYGIGKVTLSEDILKRVGRLNEGELLEMKNLQLPGTESVIFLATPWIYPVRCCSITSTGMERVILKGLKEEEISITARIITVAENYDFRTKSIVLLSLAHISQVPGIVLCNRKGISKKLQKRQKDLIF